DKIPGDHVIVCAGIVDIDIVWREASGGPRQIARPAVAGDNVPLAGVAQTVAVRADNVGLRRAVNGNSAVVGDDAVARHIHADIVTGDPVIVRPAPGDLNAHQPVPGDDIAGAGERSAGRVCVRAADGVVRGAVGNQDAVPCVG